MSLTHDFRRQRHHGPKLRKRARPALPVDDTDLDTDIEMDDLDTDLDSLADDLADMDLENTDPGQGARKKGQKKGKPKSKNQQKIDRLTDRLKQRVAQYESLVPKYQPAGKQSALEKADHLAGLTPEGVTGEMLAAMIFHLFASILNLAYFEQKRVFAKAQLSGNAYEQKADGSWPAIYPINSKGKPYVPTKADGSVDMARVITDGSASRTLIRANGFVPPPSLQEAYEQHMADFMLDMSGANSLSPYQRQILNIADQARDKVEKDLASDRVAMAKPAAAPARLK